MNCWKADREVILAVVHNNGEAIQWAANELWADREVVLAAVHNNAWVLHVFHEQSKGINSCFHEQSSISAFLKLFNDYGELMIEP